jgi:hypothetical protein
MALFFYLPSARHRRKWISDLRKVVAREKPMVFAGARREHKHDRDGKQNRIC